MTTASVTRSRWLASPRRLLRLSCGLWLFGVGEALLVASGLGNSPWTVLADGVSRQTPLSIGASTILISVTVMLLWIPLRQRPGTGTIANAIVIGVSIDVTLAMIGRHHPLAVNITFMLLGVAVVALGSALYLGAYLGPGPRDGLMTGLHRRTGRSIAAIRTTVEVTAATVGFALGGTFGIGTIWFALAIGPAVALALKLVGARDLHAL
ncbi:MAG: hypothetical protein QOE17_1200 [Gaiellales bacterium]|nr:hypothetical protein [Gaiellales bacterium]